MEPFDMNDSIDVKSFVAWSLILCKGTSRMKAKIMYHCLGGGDTISCNSRDLKEFTMLMMILVSTFIFHHINDPKKDLAFDAIFKTVCDEFMAAVFDTQNS